MVHPNKAGWYMTADETNPQSVRHYRGHGYWSRPLRLGYLQQHEAALVNGTHPSSYSLLEPDWSPLPAAQPGDALLAWWQWQHDTLAAHVDAAYSEARKRGVTDEQINQSRGKL